MNQSLSPLSPPTLDARASQRWLSQFSGPAPWLHEEVGSRMVQRLQWFAQAPQSWLHWEPLLGGVQCHEQLQQRLPKAALALGGRRREPAMLALGWGRKPLWRRWSARGRPPWVAAGSAPVDLKTPVQMVWSNMLLHTISDPLAELSLWRECLGEQGFVMFSCLGPGTLAQLRRVHQAMSWPAPAHEMTDMHDWGDMLLKAGFSAPVVDMETLRLSYSSAQVMLDELRTLGRNLSVHRRPHLLGRGWKKAWLDAVERLGERDSDGRLVLSFEVIYGHAHKGPEKTLPAGVSQISLQDMRHMLSHGLVK